MATPTFGMYVNYKELILIKSLINNFTNIDYNAEILYFKKYVSFKLWMNSFFSDVCCF